MWTHLEPHSAKVEQVFEPLCKKAAGYKCAWSIAELRLAEEDTRWLRSWFSCLGPENYENWAKSVMLTKLPGDSFATYRQMFGSLLICVGAEVLREESKEDSVWPAIRGILPDVLRRELFLSDGQPSILTKEIIVDGARALNLRHAIDIEGTQQWFITIKLQFGFTFRGAKNRLAEWLVNLGRPHAVQYLNGESEFPELESESFKTLWRALKQHRQGLIEESQARTTLQQNPWVKAHWIDSLLKETKERILILGTGERDERETKDHAEEVSGEELCPIAGIALEWPKGTTPRFRFRLDRQAIEDEVCGTKVIELDFYIDGKNLRRWLRQRDGSWAGEELIYAEPDKFKRQSNLSPKTLAVRSRTGETLIEWDFADSGLSEEVLVFDLDRARVVKTGEERLEPNRSYAIICDCDCEIQGCRPTETFERKNISRKAIRLPTPLNENLGVSFGDFLLWQPIRQESDQRPRFPLTLMTPPQRVLSLNDRSKLHIEGLPEDAESVELLIHRKIYKVQRDNGTWRTFKEVTITPELAARQRRVQVQFLSGGRTHTEKPRLAFKLLGAVMLRYKQDGTAKLEMLKHGDQLNRSEGAVSLRIWTPEQDPGAKVLEGNFQVARLRHSKLRLSDIPCHGGKLRVLCRDRVHDLGILCVNTGCITEFLPAMLNNPSQLFLSQEKDPGELGEQGYSLLVWAPTEKRRAKLKYLSDALLPGSTERIWKINCSEQPMAIALTWKGAWLGAWWDLMRIRDYLDGQADASKRDFAIIKWLRVPVLDPTLSLAFSKTVMQSSARFIKTWLNDAGLPDGLQPHGHIEGLDSVVRHFLWNDFPPAQAQETIDLVTKKDVKWYQEDRCVGYLESLLNISPILLWKGLEECLRYHRDKIIHLLNFFTRAQAGLPLSATHQQLDYKFQELGKQASRVTGISEIRLEEVTRAYIRAMSNKQWHPPERDHADLLKLGETIPGRRYLSARIGQHWLDQSR